MTVPLYQAKAEFFRTLGHPARIRVLELLSERDHAVHELLDEIDIESSNLSQQLAVLRRAGLVDQRREGGQVRYSISVPQVRDLLVAARAILYGLLDSQSALKSELQPAPGRAAPASGRAAPASGRAAPASGRAAPAPEPPAPTSGRAARRRAR